MHYDLSSLTLDKNESPLFQLLVLRLACVQRMKIRLELKVLRYKSGVWSNLGHEIVLEIAGVICRLMFHYVRTEESDVSFLLHRFARNGHFQGCRGRDR